MHFSSTPQRPPLTRLLVVGVIHMTLLAAIVQGLSTRILTREHVDPLRVAIIKPEDLPKPKEPPPDVSRPKFDTTRVYVPPVIDPPDFKSDDVPPVTVTDKILLPLPPQKREPQVKEEEVVPPVKKAALHLPARAGAGDCSKPEYPPQSLRNGEEGTVALAFLIGRENQVLEAKVEKSSGSRALDKAALAALSLCHFQAASTDGKPEVAWARLEYVWKIE